MGKIKQTLPLQKLHSINYYVAYLMLFFVTSIIIYSSFNLTPIADDYWYAALIREHGFIGALGSWLETTGGLIFKETVIFTLSLPIAYLPIGYGSGLTHILAGIIVAFFVTLLVKKLSPKIWQSISKGEKIFLYMAIFVIHFIINSLWYENDLLGFLWILKTQSYDLIFWNTLQIYYLTITAILVFWFVQTFKSKNKNTTLKHLNLLFFGLALGTTNYTLVGTLFIGLTLYLLSSFKSNRRILKAKAQKVAPYFIYTIFGVMLSFSFSSNWSRADTISGKSILFCSKNCFEYSLDLGIRAAQHYIAAIVSPGLILTALTITFASYIIFLNKKIETTKIFKTSLLFFAVSLATLITAYIIDLLTTYLFWHYNHSVFFLRIAVIFFSIALGITISKTKIAPALGWMANIALSALLIMSALNYSHIIQERQECWLAEPCRSYSSGEDREADWISEQWQKLEKYLPDRF